MPTNQKQALLQCQVFYKKVYFGFEIEGLTNYSADQKKKLFLIADEKPWGLINVGLFRGSGITVVQSLVSLKLSSSLFCRPKRF